MEVLLSFLPIQEYQSDLSREEYESDQEDKQKEEQQIIDLPGFEVDEQ